MGKVMKIVLIIVLVLVILFAGAMMFFGSYIKINEKELPSNETVIEGVNGKKALVLYQDSKHDTAKNITMALAQELNDAGYTVVINHPSKELNYSINDYDIFAFGSAVYAGQVSEPLKNYLDNHSFEDKKVIVYAVGNMVDNLSEVDLLKSKVKNAVKVDGIKVRKGNEDKIKEFVKNFLKQ